MNQLYRKNQYQKLCKKDKLLPDINKLLQAFGKLSGYDHAILKNEYQRNYYVIMLKHVTQTKY